MPAQDIPAAIMPNSPRAAIATGQPQIFLQFSDSGFWRCGGFWRYPDSPGNRRISHGRHARYPRGRNVNFLETRQSSRIGRNPWAARDRAK